MEEKDLIVIPGAEIPEERPGTSEQLRQIYNAGQWKEIAESFNRVSEKLKEAMTPAIKAVAKVCKELNKAFSIALSKDPEIKKCLGIYRRTKSRRIRKKQITRIKKRILKR